MSARVYILTAVFVKISSMRCDNASLGKELTAWLWRWRHCDPSKHQELLA